MKRKTPRLSLFSRKLNIPEASILAFFETWKRENPEEAKKAAFDYVDTRKGMYRLWLIISIVFFLGMAVGLLDESRKGYTCTNLLQNEGKLIAANVINAKKRMADNYEISFSFTPEASATIAGKVITVSQDFNKMLQNNNVSVLYALSKPKCWEMSEVYGNPTVNWAKRRAYTAMSFLMGIFFLIVGAYGSFYSQRRLTEVRPHRDEVAQMFGLR